MKRPAIAACLASLACLSSCGSPPPAEAPAGGVEEKPSAPKAVNRTPSEEIAKHWALSGELAMVVYVDAEGLAKTELFKAVVPALLARKGKEVDPCMQEIILGSRELLGGGDGDVGLVLVRVDPALKPAACIEKIGHSEKITIEGAEAGFRDGETVVAVNPGLVIAGEADLVKQALAGRSTPVPDVGLAKDEYLTARFSDPGAGMSGRASLVAAPDRFRAEISADVPEQLARMMEKQFTRSSDDPMFGPFAKMVSLKRDRGHVVAAVEIAGPPDKQARELGMMAALATSAVEKYLSRSKQAEARSVLPAIARSMVATWEAEPPPGGRRAQKLVSYPPVPKEIPRGTKVKTEPSDWAAWKQLRFEMSEPQYYQYEVRAAKDGQSADVIARGDLNGDGKPSLFKLKVTVDRKANALVIAPKIEEEDPDE